MGQLIAREILLKITGQKLAPGSPLPTEAQMMSEYQVGRGTLREALRILEVNGLLSIRPGPGGGPVVMEASTHDFGRMATLFFHARGVTMSDLMEARLIMEPVAARLAAQRRTASDVQMLERLDFTAVSEDEVYLSTSSDFHALIAQLAGNGIVAIFCQSLGEVFHAHVKGTLFPAGKARRDVINTHGAIAQAIIDQDADKAQQLMFAHMEEYAKFLKKAHPTLIDDVIDWMS